jgi:hypothetical protein
MISMDDIKAMIETEEQINFWDFQSAKTESNDQQPDVPFLPWAINDEMKRINPKTAQGEQSSMVQIDMKKTDAWESEDCYEAIVDINALNRGWLQKDCDGMELIEPTSVMEILYGK